MNEKSKRKPNILQKSFYERSTIEVAKDLLGTILVRTIDGKQISGMIVETEAYIGIDPACHAFKGKTEANKALFGPVGHAYIYFIYGNHYCLNAVAHISQEKAGGVLIRAVEPLSGIDIMETNRGTKILKQLTNGPGKLAQAFGITKQLYGVSLMEPGPLYIMNGPDLAIHVCTASRIGISQAQEKQWRFFICDNPFVSR